MALLIQKAYQVGQSQDTSNPRGHIYRLGLATQKSAWWQIRNLGRVQPNRLGIARRENHAIEHSSL